MKNQSIATTATKEAHQLIREYGHDKAEEVALLYQAISHNIQYWQFVAATIRRISNTIKSNA